MAIIGVGFPLFVVVEREDVGDIWWHFEGGLRAESGKLVVIRDNVRTYVRECSIESRLEL